MAEIAFDVCRPANGGELSVAMRPLAPVSSPYARFYLLSLLYVRIARTGDLH
jgi:hypothetical protein